ncbi:hypothetical protein ZWY2020_054733, partial [Hordeum vulgare]
RPQTKGKHSSYWDQHGQVHLLRGVLTTLVTISAAQGVLEQSLADASVPGRGQAKPLLACRQILEHQLTGRAVGVRPFQASGAPGTGAASSSRASAAGAAAPPSVAWCGTTSSPCRR